MVFCGWGFPLKNSARTLGLVSCHFIIPDVSDHLSDLSTLVGGSVYGIIPPENGWLED